MYQIWRIYLDFWGHDCKKWVWPTFGCKLGQSDPIVMQLKLDISCHLLNVYTKFQLDISKHIEEKSGKPGRTDGRTDRRTDRRTDGHCHGIIRPFFKRAYNKELKQLNKKHRRLAPKIKTGTAQLTSNHDMLYLHHDDWNIRQNCTHQGLPPNIHCWYNYANY